MPTAIPRLGTSERAAYKRCVYRWWWAYRHGLVPKRTNAKLWFGIGIHLALAHLYATGQKRNKDFIDVWRAFCENEAVNVRTQEGGNFDEAKWYDAKELGESMLSRYVEFYGWDFDWDVIYTEEPFAIEIPDVDAPNRVAAIYQSTFDGVYRDRTDGLIKLMEHKTAAQISTGHLELDDQGGGYWAIATNVLRDKGVLGPRDKIAGIEYNFLRKAMPNPSKAYDADGHQLNKDGSISKVQPPPYFHRHFVRRTARERQTQIQKIADDVANMNAHRNGELPLTKNPTRDCEWDCAFYQMCILHDQQSDWEDYRDAVYLVRDPYGPRERRKAA